jgi:hypothetical protein
MVEYKYNKDSNKFTENGHTMFEFDILRRLKRLAYLEEQIKLSRIKEVSTLTEGKTKGNLKKPTEGKSAPPPPPINN